MLDKDDESKRLFKRVVSYHFFPTTKDESKLDRKKKCMSYIEEYTDAFLKEEKGTQDVN